MKDNTAATATQSNKATQPGEQGFSLLPCVEIRSASLDVICETPISSALHLTTLSHDGGLMSR